VTTPSVIHIEKQLEVRSVKKSKYKEHCQLWNAIIYFLIYSNIYIHSGAISKLKVDAINYNVIIMNFQWICWSKPNG